MDTEGWTPMRDKLYCFVPYCNNNDQDNPDKVFVRIPKDLKEHWCNILGRSCPKRRLHCCGDHLNLEEDLENYNNWSTGHKPILKPTATLRNVEENSKVNAYRKRILKSSVNLPSTAATTSSSDLGEEQKLISQTSSSQEQASTVNRTDSDEVDIYDSGSSNSSSDDDDVCPKREAWSDREPQPSAALGAQGGLRDSHGIPCNVCNEDIKGFRYTCVQCLDVDLCDACEMRQAHATHYVLRIPGPRPLEEVRQVLQRARRELAQVLTACDEPEVFVKTEIKEELPEDPLEDVVDPNSRPHKSNILERALLSIDLPGPACPAPPALPPTLLPTPTRAHARRTDTHTLPGTSSSQSRPPVKRRLSPVEHTQTHTQTYAPHTQKTAPQIQTPTPQLHATPHTQTTVKHSPPDTTDTAPGARDTEMASVGFEVFTHCTRRGPKEKRTPDILKTGTSVKKKE